ncbi:MAG TPA: phage portal protein, partial [Gemmatimonadales bacterium]|nr:phage portal protein [Gemmatimonadales bacterium]
MILRRAMAVHPSSPDGWLVRAFGGLASLTGLAITPETAESIPAVFAAIRIISESVACLPAHLMKRLDGGGKARATDHALYTVLHDRPNPWQTPFEFYEMFVGHC